MRHNHQKLGLSLLEVLLALSILGVTLAVINELMSIGRRSAEQARDVTTAQIHCESLMAQVVSGLIAPTPVVDVPLDDPNAPGEWRYTIAVEQIDQNGMLSIQVNVSQNPEMYARPVAFGAARWMLDPEAISAASESSTSSDASSSSSSSSPSS